MIAAYDDYLVYHAAWTERMEKCYQEDGNMKWDEVIRRRRFWTAPVSA